jgi:hypothetical protein
MSTPEEETRFAEAFNELGEAAELMVEPPAVAAIRGKVRRRRAVRVTVAAVAALALVAPASWMLQQAATAEEREQPVVADDTTSETAAADPTSPDAAPTTPAETGETGTEGEEQQPVLPTFEDLVGTVMDLPSFMPGNDMVDQACPVDGAELEDGGKREFMRATGRVALLEVVHAPMSAGGEERAIAFLGCRFAEAAAFQAVVVAEGEEGGWVAEEQLIHSKANADSPYDLMADADYGVLVGVAEQYACCDMDPDELDYWVERIRIDDDGEVVSEQLEDADLGDRSRITDLSIAVEVTETEAEGVWTVTATVRNEGDRTSAPFYLISCAMTDTIEWPQPIEDCWSDTEGFERFGALEPGAKWQQTWEVTVTPSSEARDGMYFSMSIEPDRLAEGIARDPESDNNRVHYEFTE